MTGRDRPRQQQHGWGGGGGGGEVVLVQEHNSFFAYEPVLRALQGIKTIPLAQYIVPGADRGPAADSGGGADTPAAAGQGDAANINTPLPLQQPHHQPQPLIPRVLETTQSTAATQVLQTAARAATGGAELPTYWHDHPRVDLRCIVDEGRVSALPEEQHRRVLDVLSAVDLTQPAGQFPLEELLAATTLDRSQAEALRAALAQEVAVVQGPPGTGKTFLGVTLARVLLRNTRSDLFGEDVDNYDGGGGTRLMRLRLQRRAALGNTEDADRARSGLPRIGPLLVVCFTNHALDSFLEDLLDHEVTTSIVRVGGSSHSSKLEKYNLRNLQSNAGGFHVKELFARANKLEKQAEELSAALLKAAEGQRSHRPLLRTVYGVRSCVRLSMLLSQDSSQPGLLAARERPVAPSSSGGVTRGTGGGASIIEDGDLGDGDGGGLGKGEDDVLDMEDAENTSPAAAQRGQPPAAAAAAAAAGPSAVQVSAFAAPALGGSGAGSGGITQFIPATVLMAAGCEDVAEPPPPPPPPPPPRAPEEVRAMGSRRRPLDELLRSDDVWSMSRQERQVLHSALQRLRFAHLLESVREVQDDYKIVQDELQAEFSESALNVLRSAKVVGMTTSGVAKNQNLVAALKPRVLMVEEAAEVFEAHVLVCLSQSVEHLILIGDHEQLRPKPNEYDLQAASGRGLDLDVSLFERLVRGGGGPGGAAGGPGGAAAPAAIQIATLLQQRRMRPQISQLIRVPIYPELQDHPRVLSYPAVRGLASSVFFVDHDHPESGGGGASGEDRSKNNEWEALFVVALARHLLLQGYKPGDLVILVPYVGQLFRVHRALDAANVRVVLSDRDLEQMDRVGLEVDGAEGAGADSEGATRTGPGPGPGSAATVAVLPAGAGTATGAAGGGGGRGRSGGSSLVDAGRHTGARSGSGGGGKLPAEPKVVTMREGIRVATVDNFQGEEATVILLSTVRNNPDGHIGFLSQRNRINVMLSRARHGMIVLGNTATLRAAGRGGRGGGGAGMWCQVLDLLERDGCVGRALRVRCANHGTETEIHEPEDFSRLAGDGGCQAACGEALPCGHTCPRRCHPDDRSHVHVVCTRPCARLHAKCGHPCDKTCGEECGRCMRVIQEEVTLPCGHGVHGIDCWKRFEEGAIQCRSLVEVALPGCGHIAQVPCCEAAAARAGNTPCTAEVEVEMPVCGHVVRVACSARGGLLQDPTACPQAPCGALLECEHLCTGRCGSCLKSVLSGGYAELIAGWLTEAPANVRNAWSAWNLNLPRLSTSNAAPKVERFLHFLSAEQAGAAYRGSFLAFLRARLFPRVQDQQQAVVAPHARSHHRCGRRCQKILVCGHTCGAACHPGQACGRCTRPCWIACPHHAVCHKPCWQPCVPCAEACDWACKHVGRCRAPCGAPCESKLLSCGHRCPGLCGEPCPPPTYCVDPRCLGRAKENIRNQMVDQIMLRSLGDLTPEDVDEDPLVVLPSCGHAFLTSTLDGLLDLASCYDRDPTTGAWLRPKVLGPDVGGQQPVKTCPQCREPIRGVRRYGRPVNKASLDLMDRKHLAECGAKLGAADARLKALRQRLETQGQVLAEAMTQAEKEILADVNRGQHRFDAEAAMAMLLRPTNEPIAHVSDVINLFFTVCDSYLSPFLNCGLVRKEPSLVHPPAGRPLLTPGICPWRYTYIHSNVRTNERLLVRLLVRSHDRMLKYLVNFQTEGRYYLEQSLRDLNQPTGLFQLLHQGLQAYQQLAIVAAPEWVQQAVQASSFNSAFKLSEAAMRAGLAQVGLLEVAQSLRQVVRDAAAGGWVLDGPQLRELKQHALDQARATGTAALDLYNGESGFAAKNYENAAISSIRQLMSRLESFSQQVEAAELLSVLKVVAAREYSSNDAMRWLSGHLYRCPNGHPYIIGNCGGAMERATCPECGAVIGGGSHRLVAGNAPATEAWRDGKQRQLVIHLYGNMADGSYELSIPRVMSSRRQRTRAGWRGRTADRCRECAEE
ncbi:hypothetical protein VOLCADRAFT_89933 [Volvox carteri f. nagariensis]|uniref:RZ-type domain-containing protein n=1 Tax=Volvox carteri f. nagariensis TaxID=3068 RepID=D8TT17_VOLCA|nr:uncharacterized protein VOLCADRAFT_89933 [Volvox carteri f. nagariensis]EFJ49576.1 hypothetical protein VOLCADRAFT_89933 [Volvox carteri f. nagariensis]|eukprot:XP_002949557.1 hypothetical protein VOLCADRAFT_89933 [Volvox carteri f. nagariensis]